MERAVAGHVLATVSVIICLLLVISSDGAESFGRIAVDHDTLVEQFCTGETFRPRCSGGKNDVIVILSARYGRMNFGRCVVEEPAFAAMAKDPKFIGCSADVKHILDQQCSGLSECDIRVITLQNFDSIRPCYAALQMYLEASYTCIKVAAESRQCTIALTTESQHIVGGSSSSRSQTVQADAIGCGAESQPWSVEALAGQRITVSLIDFGQSINHTDMRPDSASDCASSYGYVIDRISRKNVSLCSDRRTNSDYGQLHASTPTRIYVSRSNQLQLVTRKDVSHKFIVRVEAVGCSDLAPPSDAAWLKRVDDQITVGCYMSRQSWKLNCVNGVWTGTVGVCSRDSEQTLEKEEATQMVAEDVAFHSNEMAALVAVASAGIAVCCLVICIGFICLRRQRRMADKKHGMPVNETNYNESWRLNENDVINTRNACDQVATRA